MNQSGDLLKRIEFDFYELNLGVLGVRDVRIVGQADRMMDGKIEVMITNVFCNGVDIFQLIPLDQYENMKARLAISYIDPRVGA
ncbi:MAG: hypothetical protein C4586_05720 [Anaerolineaceae bacterium]|nr:MAG: hypothetical protein C4586_05720 [Anaerolineaceae bacterium]